MVKSRVMLLPGFLSTSSAWDSVAALLQDEAAIIRSDLPGFGARAQRPVSSLEAMVGVLSEVIAAEAPTHIVGHSMGGIVALALGLSHQEVQGIGAVGLPVFESERDGRAFIGRRGRMLRLLVGHHSLAHAGCAIARVGRGAWVPAARMRWKEQPENVFREAFVHSRTAHYCALRQVIFAGHVRPLASALHRPVFLIHGEQDRAAPLAAARATAADHHWDFTAVPGGSHQLHVEHPEAVAGWLRTQVFQSTIEARG